MNLKTKQNNNKKNKNSLLLSNPSRAKGRLYICMLLMVNIGAKPRKKRKKREKEHFNVARERENAYLSTFLNTFHIYM